MSDFWKRKIRTFFRVFDVNKDGLVTVEDFEILAERYGEGYEDERKEIVREKLIKLFSTYDVVCGGTGRMTEERFIDGCKKLRNDTNYPTVLKEVAAICYSLLDSDGDGIIDEDNYARLFYNLRIPDHEALAKVSFAALDTNHDGKLNFEETSTGYYDYMQSDDESLPSRIFFGPLV